ncbi:hypothetical protein FIV42_19090 [Persicimonas caeni]|uniref:Uncharacterized protein n=1 Tax=Persicimonas caeni TaxID=2292766 RepID=A0A4Y6PWR0_PERCE|nr:hypothetical protein [Persicimonas caeni]QDG52771.1 hypothetical protein FIV42_19090 [Persicimonas caeni]QED33993.1 hypothetical protein FRD00_19085 [Persicimonas caeni]
MSDDGEKQAKSLAEALAESAEAAQEDATVQISKTELAAIRQSASNGSMTPEMLREINRNRSGKADEEDDATQTFDRRKLSAMLEEHSSADDLADGAIVNAAVEQARGDDEPNTTEFVLDEDDEDDENDGDLLSTDGLDELSDADLHAIVFGDEDEAADEDPAAGLDELSDADLHAVVFGAEDDPLADPLDDPEFDSLEELTADDPEELEAPAEPEAPALPTEPPAQPAPPAPVADKPRDAQPPASMPVDDEPLDDFRGAESRLLSVGALLGSLAMIVAGGLRLGTSDMLGVLHPVVAGMMIAVGILILMGMLVSFLQRR